MEAFLNQLAIVLLVAVAALLAYATYKVVYSKMNQVDVAEETIQPEDNNNTVSPRPVIRARGEAVESHKEEGEKENNGLTEDIEDNE